MGAPIGTLEPTLTDTSFRHAGTALTDGNGRAIPYDGLRDAIEQRLDEFALGHRSLVVVRTTNSLDTVISYLALMHGGHVPLLAPDGGDSFGRLVSAWNPAAVVDEAGGVVTIERARSTPNDLHPDLALLLSTSGSTGCPKLVRLSHRNLVSNARSIVDSLALTASDVGVTNLPLHYCYGLSVLHSHLLAGARVVVTDLSVVDPCFRRLVTAEGVTNLGGVPHTYQLLDRAQLERWWPPTLRQLTQAGGRLDPAAVRRWADIAARHDAEFFVMYGQTEATARIACLPPRLACTHPSAIGTAIPGGRLSLRPVDGAPPDVGELIYQGDNVMMGYAESSADLARGAELDELATGDLARYDPSVGVFEIVGRRSRFVKPFGLRIDLDHLERSLSNELGHQVAVTGDDERLAIVAPGSPPDRVRNATRTATGLPPDRIAVVPGPIPTTTTGKVDYGAIPIEALVVPTDPAPGRYESVARAFAVVTDGPIRPDDTFVALGGDSLSYVECSLRLEAGLGPVPSDWHLRTVRELVDEGGPVSRRTARVDSTVVLRAVAICLVVSTHMRLWHLPGGAHTLLAVAGYNFARFVGSIGDTGARVRAGLRTVARVAVPTVLWVAAGTAFVGASYGVGTLLLVNNYVGPRSHEADHWHFWFIEVFVHVVVGATLLLAVPAVRRLERRHHYLFPLALLLASLALRMEWAYGDDWYNLRFRTHGVVWFFLLGWLIHASRTGWQRVATSAVCLAVVPGFFQIAQRDWRITVALIALTWIPTVRVPRVVVRPLGAVAAASMWIYLSHFTIWPPLDDVFVREVAYLLTIAGGVVLWYAAERLAARLTRLARATTLRPVNRTEVLPA